MVALMNVSDVPLFHMLKARELELHGPAAGHDRNLLDALLHDDFTEISRSGAGYTKADILGRLPTEPHDDIVADEFHLRQLSESVALLTYRSTDRQADGTYSRFTLRSSLWEHSARGWQMRFHQGTPTAPFAPFRRGSGAKNAPVADIRSAAIEDAAAIAQIHVAGWQSAYRGIVPQAHLDSMTTDKREAYWRQAISEGAPQVRVATLERDVVGWVAFGQCRDPDRPEGGEIWAVYVHPSCVGTGVGRALWLEAREELFASGFGDVSLWVLARNSRARRFYERAGFGVDPDSTKPVVIGGDTLEEVRYVRLLPVPLQRIESVVLFVADIDATARWYAEVLDSRVEYENPRYAFVRGAGSVIGFHPADDKCPGGVGGATVYWKVADLTSVINALVRRGARVYRGPGTTDLNAKVAMLLDPFGNTLGVNEGPKEQPATTFGRGGS